VKSRALVLFCIGIALMVTACAGKDNVSPVDVETQAFEDLRVEIREAVVDPANEAEAIRLVGVLQDDFEALRSSIAERSRRLKELNADYDTPRSEFEAFLTDAEAEMRGSRQRTSETHHALLRAMTAEERSQIDKVRSKAISAAIRSMQSI